MISRKRVFIAFAVEDRNYRDLLKGQSLNTGSPFEYIDISVKEPWDREWKTRCRSRIKGCDGVVALLSRNSLNADGQKWEITCAREERVPLIGIHIYTDDSSSPPEMDGVRKVRWRWDDIRQFIDRL
jgi:hypothetical protein